MTYGADDAPYQDGLLEPGEDIRMTCPFGHDDLTANGYCADEVRRNIRRLQAEQLDRADRGDLSGAAYTARHLARWWNRLSAPEREACALCCRMSRRCNHPVTIL